MKVVFIDEGRMLKEKKKEKKKVIIGDKIIENHKFLIEKRR
jgi:hypothetical protein